MKRMRSLAALRADHENAAAAESAWRPIGVRASVRGLEQARPLSLTQPPPLRGFRSAAGHESLTKGHEILFAPKDRGTACVCWRKANGPFLAGSSFVTFCAIFVSRDFGITRRVGTWRRRRVKRSFKPGDGSALPIAEGDLPRSRVFVFRAKRP